MKYLLLAFCFILSNLNFSQSNCIDSNLIDSNIFCPSVIDFVCGCDGVTYNNGCEATYYFGISSYTQGACSQNCQADFNFIDSACAVEFFPFGATSYFWDFGDGNSGQGVNQVHTYANDGIYNVCMYAYDQNGNLCDTVCQNVVALGCSNNPNSCNSGFQYSSDSSCNYTFYAYGASSYEWVFDDMIFTDSIITIYISNLSMDTVCLYSYDENGVICDTNCLIITCDIADLDRLSNVSFSKLFPNPTKDFSELIIHSKNSENIEVELYSIHGELLETVFKGIVLPGENRFEVGLSNYERGLYVIQLTSPLGKTHLKIIKE